MLASARPPPRRRHAAISGHLPARADASEGLLDRQGRSDLRLWHCRASGRRVRLPRTPAVGSRR
eukprot:7437857-Alexandrium_andersonii.AAC.1